MLRLTECNHCGESLHSFIEELEIGLKVHLVICPTCYKTYYSGLLARSALSFLRVIRSFSGQRVTESFCSPAMKTTNKEVIRNYEY